MIPPGWNVTEPLSLAASLYRVVESLKAAPEEAKAFTTQIENFSRSLKQLQRVIDEELAPDPREDHEDLLAILANCQLCVERCQKFQESFQELSKAESARRANAGQVALWVWNNRNIVRLRHEIDSQMSNITFNLQIKNLYVPIQFSPSSAARQFEYLVLINNQCRWTESTWDSGYTRGASQPRRPCQWNLQDSPSSRAKRDFPASNYTIRLAQA